MAEVIAAGVISSLLSLGVAALAASWGRMVLVPWLEERSYNGVRLEGEWRVVSESAQEATLELKQNAHRLTGTCTFVALRDGDDFESARQFTVVGEVVDRLVRLRFNHVDKTRIGFGVFVVEVVKDARKMLGWQTNYSVATARIVSCRCGILRPGVPLSVLDLKTLRTLGEGPVGVGEEQLMLQEVREQRPEGNDDVGTEADR